MLFSGFSSPLRHFCSLRLGALRLLCFNGAGYKHCYLLTYLLWIRNCSAYSELMMSHAHLADGRQLADATAYTAMSSGDVVVRTIKLSFRLVRFEMKEPWAFSWNDVMANVLIVWRHVRTPTQSIDAYLREEQPCQMLFRSSLKQWSLRFFEECCPNQKNNNENWISFWSK